MLESRHADGVPIRPISFLLLQPRAQRTAYIHVDRDYLSAKFWLDPIQLARNFGFRAHELRAIQPVVEDHEKDFLEAWNEFFGVHGG
ncbi:MAG: DUF4160 domain-containing protein [Terriglobales bacterium]